MWEVNAESPLYNCRNHPRFWTRPRGLHLPLVWYRLCDETAAAHPQIGGAPGSERYIFSDRKKNPLFENRWDRPKEDSVLLQLLPTSVGVYVCPECKYTSARKPDVRRHLQVHLSSPGHAFKCSVCGGDFKNYRSLSSHIKCVHGYSNVPNFGESIRRQRISRNEMLIINWLQLS